MRFRGALLSSWFLLVPPRNQSTHKSTVCAHGSASSTHLILVRSRPISAAAFKTRTLLFCRPFPSLINNKATLGGREGISFVNARNRPSGGARRRLCLALSASSVVEGPCATHRTGNGGGGMDGMEWEAAAPANPTRRRHRPLVFVSSTPAFRAAAFAKAAFCPAAMISAIISRSWPDSRDPSFLVVLHLTDRFLSCTSQSRFHLLPTPLRLLPCRNAPGVKAGAGQEAMPLCYWIVLVPNARGVGQKTCPADSSEREGLPVAATVPSRTPRAHASPSLAR